MKKDSKSKQFVVIGLGRFGSEVARTLYNLNRDVLCIDKNSEVVREISDEVTHVVQADARDEDVLSQLDISNYDTAVIGISNDIASSLMITLLLQEFGIKEIIAKASSDTHKKALYKIGATKVVQPERDIGIRVARKAAFSKLIDYIDLSSDYSLFEINCPDRWIGKTITDLDIRKRYNVNILGIKRLDKFTVIMSNNFLFEKNDIIILIGSPKDFKYQMEEIEN